MNKKRYAVLLIFFCIICFGTLGILLKMYACRKNVSISHESGIYYEEIELAITVNSPATILYTTNGTVPSVGAADTMIYTAPILLEVAQETKTYSFKFVCLFRDGTQSDIYARDYIVEKDSGRFTTTYVVSLVGEEEALFGYENGIFVRGRQFDEFMAANPDVDRLNKVIPANYFSDTEVPVRAAIFTRDGSVVAGQNCGVKIYGNITRAKNQKSFRLTARYDYDDVNEFSYCFLPNLISDKTNTAIDEFHKLSFHNAGNDNGYGFIRTELIGELARESGFPDVLVAESAAVYINGKYQGVYWLQNTFDERYFKEKYGGYEGKMVVCEGMLDKMTAPVEADNYEKEAAAGYNDFIAWLTEADIQKEADWKRICDTIDINNFAQYMAIEYLVYNYDWPHNNVKVYRYTAADGEYEENTVFDGKYRYLLYDTDYGMGLKFLGWYGADADSRSMWYLAENSEENESSRIFAVMLEREEFRTLFMNAVLCMLNENFSASHVRNVLSDFCAKYADELQYMMEETQLLKNSLWESDDNSIANVYQEWTKIIEFAEKRYLTVNAEFDDTWQSGEQMNVKISMAEKGNIRIGCIDAGNDYDGYWLENVPMMISCDLPEGVEVMGYWVNSELILGETLRLLPAAWKEMGNLIVIEPMFEYEEKASVHVSEYHIEGAADYVILENNGWKEVLLSDYYISDSEKEPYLEMLPGVVLLPGESFVVYGSKYTGEMTENSVQVTFSWNSEEVIVLSGLTEGIIEKIKP